MLKMGKKLPSGKLFMLKMGKKLPSGKLFMLKMGKKILNQIKNMPAGKPKEMLRACFMRKKDMSLREIAEQLEVPFSTIRGWLVRVMKRGMNGIYDKKSPGRKRMLGP